MGTKHIYDSEGKYIGEIRDEKKPEMKPDYGGMWEAIKRFWILGVGIYIFCFGKDELIGSIVLGLSVILNVVYYVVLKQRKLW